MVLLNILLHIASDSNILLEPREEELLFIAVVFMYQDCPCVHESDEVFDVFVEFDVWCLEVDAVEDSDDHVVDEGHF